MKKTARPVFALLSALIIFTLQIGCIPAGIAAGPTSHTITCENCEALDTELNVISAASAGMKVIVQFKRKQIPEDQYTTQEIVSDDAEITRDANGVQSFIMSDQDVFVRAALYPRKSGMVDLTQKDTADADFELLDSLIETNMFSAYEQAGGSGNFALDLNRDEESDVTIILDHASEKASVRRENGADAVTGEITLPIHLRDGNDWSRKYSECVFRVTREYCSVTFDANGGKGTMEDVRIQKGKEYTLPECTFTAPVNMEFDQWNKGRTGTQITVNEDMVIRAMWKMLPPPEPETCTVTFAAGGGTGTMNPATVNKGEKYTLPTCGFTAPEGKEFDQWDKGVPGTQITVDADTVVTALWKDLPKPEPEPEPEPETCTVTFAAGGGKGTMKPVTVNKGSKYTLPACRFKAPSNYRFARWDKGAPGTKITVNTDTVVRAVWEKNAKTKTRIIAKKKTFKAKAKTKKYTVTLKDAKNKPVRKAKVTLEIGGCTYKATTNNKGRATFKITKLKKKGKYTATIKYSGSAKYKGCTKKVKIRIK